VEAWVMPDMKSGVLIAHGGPLNGYAITLQNGKPQWQVRADEILSIAESTRDLGEGWHHLVGTLGKDGEMKLYVDGKEVASGKSKGGLLTANPKQPLELGGDGVSAVGAYPANARTACLLDEFAIYHRVLEPAEITKRHAEPGAEPVEAVLACSFDGGGANDESGGKNNGVVSGIDSGKGMAGSALWIQRSKAVRGRKGNKPKLTPGKNSYVEHQWTQKVPIFTRAMALANDTLVIAGPPDIIDEEYTFERLTQKDDAVREQLEAQESALNGEDGAIMQLVSIESGESNQRLDLESPPVWDGMAVARGKLFIAGEDGKVRCFASGAE